MKIRNGFVSNSSSSSFLILGDVDVPFKTVELNEEQKDMICKIESNNLTFYMLEKLYKNEKVRLSEFVTGYDVDKNGNWEFYNHKNNEYITISDEICEEYKDGQMGDNCPYDASYYKEIAEDIWLYMGKDYKKETQEKALSKILEFVNSQEDIPQDIAEALDKIDIWDLI